MPSETVVRNNLRNRAYTVIGVEMQVQVIDPNPPPKKRYGYLRCLKEHFFKNFRKSSEHYYYTLNSFFTYL